MPSSKTRLVQWVGCVALGLCVTGLLVFLSAEQARGRLREQAGLRYSGLVLDPNADKEWLAANSAATSMLELGAVPGHLSAAGVLEQKADFDDVASNVLAGALRSGGSGSPAVTTGGGGGDGRSFTMALKAKKTTISKNSGVINLMNRRGEYDAGFVCTVFDLERTVTHPSQVVAVHPHVTRVAQRQGGRPESIIHHMDIFMCETPASATQATLDNAGDSEFCAAAGFVNAAQGPCHEMPYAYDKGSNTFEFPKEVGWRVGPGTPYKSMVMAIHYLLPEWWDPKSKLSADARPGPPSSDARVQ